jgi:adenylate cyclase
MLYEMLTAKPAFAGGSPVQILHAVVYERLPSLGGSPAIGALDRIIQRAAAKKPEDRYPSAEAMAQALRAALLQIDPGEAPLVHPVTRLIVLPFRMLRPDPETGFLAFSLPDAISSTLSGLESLVVRSSAAASRFSSEAVDLKTLAAEADIDVALIGTLLRAGDQVRLSTQLLEAPGGTILWSHTAQVPLRDIFQLQDDLAHRIVDSLALPLTAREHRLLNRDVPASANAYEFYLRANELAAHSQGWSLARKMYERSLEEDPDYAPAWARLGRIHRVLAKYMAEDPRNSLARAEAAFRRAFEINPDLSVAHNLSVYLDADLGRAQAGMVRLLDRVQSRRADPELFAGLCHACRYCGLLDASVAAFEQAKQLDRLTVTSVIWTFWLLGDYSRALEEAASETVGYIPGLVLASMGRDEEAIATLRRREQMKADVHGLGYVTSLRALLEGTRGESLEAIERTVGAGYTDPEGLYFLGRSLARLGEHERALEVLERSVESGYSPFSAMARDPWLDPLRGGPRFAAILRRASALYRDAQAAWRQASGDRLLGLSA